MTTKTQNRKFSSAGEGLRPLAGEAGSRARISEEAEDAESVAGFTGGEIHKQWRRWLKAVTDAKGGNGLAASMTRRAQHLGIKPRAWTSAHGA